MPAALPPWKGPENVEKMCKQYRPQIDQLVKITVKTPQKRIYTVHRFISHLICGSRRHIAGWQTGRRVLDRGSLAQVTTALCCTVRCIAERAR